MRSIKLQRDLVKIGKEPEKHVHEARRDGKGSDGKRALIGMAQQGVHDRRHPHDNEGGKQQRAVETKHLLRSPDVAIGLFLRQPAGKFASLEPADGGLDDHAEYENNGSLPGMGHANVQHILRHQKHGRKADHHADREPARAHFVDDNALI
ncbi:hypothetical protein [Cohnella algarum]|uniref:hypothetical protein n=1 Tax=Cohnella algarum TaxID=2044859 RepID=UPI0019686D73|nr:hypothetical protein [Cohnella algarum]MBN2984794.1 hypothetical protein [Cohnella algarum]